MAIVRNNTLIMWKSFAFPISIISFKIKEDAKVASYEYAGRNGSEQERVQAYRIFNISGVFTNDSGDKDPTYYVQKLRELNSNEPWVLVHPVLGTYRCICKSLDIEATGEDMEHGKGVASLQLPKLKMVNMSGGWWAPVYKKVYNKQVVVSSSIQASPIYKFTMELWESIPPNAASLQDNLSKLFPATSVKPGNDNYMTSNKYNTVLTLYWAIVNGRILPWTDPIRNAEWLGYEYAFRKQAYDMWVKDPKWLKTAKTDKALKISIPKIQNTYAVAVGDTALSITKKLQTTLEKLFNANRWVKVRTVPNEDSVYWKRASVVHPWDMLIVP